LQFANLKLVESLDPEEAAFKEAHHVLITTLMEIRDAAKDPTKTWKDYTRRIDEVKRHPSMRAASNQM
jgi:uncharacterized protein YifE (UPF0438 family)